MAKIINGQDNPEQKKTDPNYWQGFKDLYQDVAFTESKKHEFNKEAAESFELGKLSNLSRRKFLALVSASAAFAAAGCSDYRGNGKIIPYRTKPEEITLGIPNYYASTYVENESIMVY